MSISEPAGSRYGLRNLVWTIVVLGGAGIWLIEVMTPQEAQAWRALLASFLFFTSLAGGLVVWPAIVRTCNGRWHRNVERLAASGISFAIPSILALILLWIGSPRWSPWHNTTHHQGFWMDNAFIFSRDLTALCLFWGVAAYYLAQRRHSEARAVGGILILVYCLVFSLLGMDLVMGLDPKWFSTLAGGYFFMSGLYIAITGWGFLSVWLPEADGKHRHDIGKLIVGFSMITVYLMYSHLLPFWYENLPNEVRFPLARIADVSWRRVSYMLVAVVYLGPMVMLLTERAKRNRWSMGGISLLILTGMWVERWWLIAPTLQPELHFGVLECATGAAFAGILALGLDQFERRMPPAYLRGER